MANEALDTINKVVKNLIKLKIVTVVTNIQATKNADGDFEYTPEEGPIEKGCVTKINLLEGDIQNYIGTGLSGDEYAQITRFHATQVEKAQEVIKGNMSVLKDMALFIKELASE